MYQLNPKNYVEFIKNVEQVQKVYPYNEEEDIYRKLFMKKYSQLAEPKNDNAPNFLNVGPGIGPNKGPAMGPGKRPAMGPGMGPGMEQEKMTANYSGK